MAWRRSSIDAYECAGATAWLVFRYLGPGFLSRGWLNTEFIWAASLVLVGAVSLHGSI